MTDKERVEEIDEVVSGLLNNSVELFNFVGEFYSQADQLAELEETYKKTYKLLADSVEKQKSLQAEPTEQAELAQELEESCNIGNCLSKFTNKTETDNKRYQEALEKIKDNSSCVVAFGYAVKALEESK